MSVQHQPGQRVADRYRLRALIGSGRQGSVWEAEDTQRGDARVALKFFATREATREAEVLLRVEHPSLPRALDAGSLDDGSFLVMERVEGAPLAAGLGPAAVVRVGAQIADALAALHDLGIVHGDVKPANVLVAGERACLVDLGLATRPCSSTEAPAGTLAYMAPDALAGELSPASDLFSLGVTLITALTGRHPFVEDPTDRAEVLDALVTRRPVRSTVIDAISPALRASLVALVARDPEARPPSARAWLGRWSRDGASLTGDAVTPLALTQSASFARPPLVARERERDQALVAVERGLGADGVGVALIGPPGAGRRRVAHDVIRLARVAGAGRGELPDLREDLPEEVHRPTLVLLLDATSERVANAAEVIARMRRFGALAAPVALVATCTDVVRAEGLTNVTLGPLDRSQTHELLTALHGGAVAPATVDAWLDVTAALPGRVVTLARTLGPDRIAHASREELFMAAATLHRARLPGDLSPDARRVAFALAAAEEPLPRALLAALTRATVGAALAELQGRGLAVTRDDRVDLLASIACDEATASEREDLGAAADAWLALYGATRYALRARFAALRGDRGAAWAFFERAASDPATPRATAVRLLEQAAPYAPSTSVHGVWMARTLLGMGDGPRALAALAGLSATTETRVLEVEALRRAGRRDDARALAGRLANDPDEAVRAVGAVALARDAIDRGDLDAARAPLGDVLASGERIPSAVRARALETAGLLAWAEGAGDRARDVLERADALCLSAGDGAARARVQAVLGMVAQQRGRHEDARRRYHDAWLLASECGDAHAAATYATNLGAVELERGALGESARWLTQATRTLTALGRIPELARALANLASLLEWVGDRRAAADVARRARDAATVAGDAVTTAFAAAVEADASLSGRAAGDALTQAADALASAGDARHAAETRARAASRHLAAGELARAESALDGAGGVDDVAMVALARVEVALARRAPPSRVGDLVALAARAAEADPSIEHDLWLSRLRALAASARGDRTEATRARKAWRARVDSLAATLPESLAALWSERHGERDDGAQGAGEGAGGRAEGPWRRLVEITRRLNDEPSLRLLLELVMDAIIELTGASRGFLLWKSDDGEPRVRTARNLGRRDLEGEEMAFSRSVAERVAREGEALVTVDAAADGRFDASESVAAMKLRSILAVPLRVHGEVIGTVYVDDRFRVGAFGEEALEVARAFADAAAVAIHNARTQSELRRALRRSERLSRELERRVDAQQVELEATRQALSPDATRGKYDAIVGRGAAMMKTLALIDRVAPTAMPVLLQGESGTGKELVARAIHANSARSRKPFVAENCGAIPETLLESALFGHVKGAFTGADRTRAGLFEVADGGTLFLDEVGEMSPAMQARLLRVLQEGEVRPVGGERSRKVDVRVVAATHRDLEDMVRKGTFREDLYYRLAVMVLPVPALRERREDIPVLVAHLLARHGRAGVSIDRRAMACLTAAPWPGNVRQLENEIQRAAALADGTIREEDLSPGLRDARVEASREGSHEGASATHDLRHAVEGVERDLVERVLREHGWNQSRSAKALGLSRFGLQKKMKRLGIPSRDPVPKLRVVK